MDEAIEWSSRFADVVGDVKMEIGTVCEPWDLGMAPKPEGLIPIRFLVTHKADKLSESGAAPDPAMVTKMGALIGEMRTAGVLLATEGLRPGSDAKRLTYNRGTRVKTIDGPFTESKELIAGFSIFKLHSMDEALNWADRFGSLFPEVTVDVRPL